MANWMNQSQKLMNFSKFAIVSFYLISILLIFPPQCIPQKIHIPDPDLKWTPKPFIFHPGKSIRYIDFKNGDDNNSGLSKEQPWKHHPWDKNAKGKSADCRGIHTYCFKKGVIYRGALSANESGKENNPIRLTIDPTWGTGDAKIYGSIRIEKRWHRCTDKECPNIPETGRMATWYIDPNFDFIPRKVWELRDDHVIVVHLAR